MSLQTYTSAHRVLPAEPFGSLRAYVDAGGGRGLEAARAVDPVAVIDELAASGLRGRGGAGFPTGTKWRTIADYASTILDTQVVVNAAEGEPGTFKDRSILRSNPYAVLEGALIAAHAMGSRAVLIATKARFEEEIERLGTAIDEVRSAGWTSDVEITVVEGPEAYLYGEETALLEVLDGRPPFPRIAPPWRRGITEVVAGDADVDSESGLSADVELAASDGSGVPPPVLVDNVETLANVPAIIARGAEWFRSMGTRESPGSIVCTVTGATRRPEVVEVAMGTPLRDVIAASTDEPADTREIIAVLMGVSNGVVTRDQFDTPISYEAFTALGSGLGSASFIVIDDRTDPVAVAAGASRFLAVESCGQCEPCKRDGLQISGLLAQLCQNDAPEDALETIELRLSTITDGARCNLAVQHQVVVGSIMRAFGTEVGAHVSGAAEATEPDLVAELIGIDGETVTVDSAFLDKQPDWTFDTEDSGETPVERLTDHRA